MKQVLMIAFLHQPPSLRQGGAATAVRAWVIAEAAHNVYCDTEKDVDSHRERGRGVYQYEGP